MKTDDNGENATMSHRPTHPDVRRERLVGRGYPVRSDPRLSVKPAEAPTVDDGVVYGFHIPEMREPIGPRD